MISKKHNKTHFLCFERGDQIAPLLRQYVIDHQIAFGIVSGIGAIKNVAISYYDFARSTYVPKSFNHDEYELNSLTGNIAWDGEDSTKPIMHLHTTFSDTQYRVIGGHFDDAEVTGVVEICIQEIASEKVLRQHFKRVPFKTLDLTK